MPSARASMSYASIAAAAPKPQKLPALTLRTNSASTSTSTPLPTPQSVNRVSACISHEPRATKRLPNTAPAAKPQTMPAPQPPPRLPASNTREPCAGRQLPDPAPIQSTDTSPAKASPFSASEIYQLGIPSGPAAANWRTGPSRSLNTDRHCPARGKPSSGYRQPSYAASQRYSSSTLPSSRRYGNPGNDGSRRHSTFQDPRSQRFAPYSKHRANPPRSVPPSHQTPDEPEALDVILLAEGPQDKPRVVHLFWHCKVPTVSSEVDLIRQTSAEVADEKGYDIIRVRMAIHNTKSMITESGRETVAGEPWHWTLEFQHSDSAYVDTSHIYTNTVQVERDEIGRPVFETKGLAIAGVTKDANGKVVDKVVEIWKGVRGSRAVGVPNQTERIRWEYRPDVEEGDIIEPTVEPEMATAS